MTQIQGSKAHALRRIGSQTQLKATDVLKQLEALVRESAPPEEDGASDDDPVVE